MRLLVTRPEPDGERTAATLRARGHEVLVAPLLRIEPLADAELGAGPWGGAGDDQRQRGARRSSGIRAAPSSWPLPAFAVGRRTRRGRPRAAGFGDVTSADGNAQDLVRLIAARLRCARRCSISRARIAPAISRASWRPHGVAVETAVVYRAVAAAALAPRRRGAQAGRLDGVLHFSRRSAEIYLDCAEAAGVLDRALRPFHYCLSRQVAEPLAAAGAGNEDRAAARGRPR